MISYQELVASLTEWRARQGLPTGQTDYLGEPMPMPLVGPPQPESAIASADEYAELVDSEILSEEPDPESAYGEIGGSEGYPGEEPISFPDTDAASPDQYGSAYGEAPAADQWSEAQPEAGGWDQAPAEAASWDSQPAQESWDTPQADAGYGQSATDSWDPAPAAYEGEVTEFAPPPDVEDDSAYADVMEEPDHGDPHAQTWDTEAEAHAVAPSGGGLYEEDPYATSDAGGFEAGAGGPPPLEAADEGESTMDVDPDEILDADDLPGSASASGEIGGGGDALSEPPPLEPPPEGEQGAAGDPYGDGSFDPFGKPDPER